MSPNQHSAMREGTVAGLLGGAGMAAWFFLVDLAGGRPLRTPSVLGQVVFGGDATPSVGTIDAGAVAGYTLLHFAVFIAVGILLARLVHLAIRNLALRMGLWVGLLIAFLWFNGHMYMLSRALDARLQWWAILGGSLIAVALMAGYLWRAHPQLAESFRQVGLGDAEAQNPPAPPQGPRV